MLISALSLAVDVWQPSTSGVYSSTLIIAQAYKLLVASTNSYAFIRIMPFTKIK